MPTLSIVVACAANRVIGRDGGLPWHLPEDLRHFRRLTLGKPVLMGRKTFESIGRPLPGRRNVVLSRQRGLELEGCEVVDSAEAALELLSGQDEVMVIGGARVYEEFLPSTSRIYRTRVHADADGDTRFPRLDPAAWHLVAAQEYPATSGRPTGYTFETLERVRD